MQADDAPSSSIELVSKSERGTPLVVTGRVLDTSGKPVANAYVRAFQADADGIYTHDRTRRPRLCGVARTGSDGRFRFVTIRPGRYPNTRQPEHVHFEYWTDAARVQRAELHFSDDPHAHKENARTIVNGRVERDLSHRR